MECNDKITRQSKQIKAANERTNERTNDALLWIIDAVEWRQEYVLGYDDAVRFGDVSDCVL